MDQLTARLTESNSKVATQAACSAGALAASPGGSAFLAASLITLMPALAMGLGVGNAAVADSADAAVDALVAHIEPTLMVQHLSHCVGKGSLRSRCVDVTKLQAPIARMAPVRPRLVAKWAYPAAVQLTTDGKNSPEGRAATASLLRTLAAIMGPAFMEQASGLPPPVKAKFQEAAGAAGATPRASTMRRT